MNTTRLYQRAELLGIVCLSIAYAVSGYIVLTFISISDINNVVWPGSGLAVASVLLGGRKVWPGIVLGGTLLLLLVPQSAVFIAALTVANVFAALFSHWLITRRAGFDLSLRRTKDYFSLCIFAAGLSVGLSSVAVVGGLFLIGDPAPASFLLMLRHWWMADVLGVLVFAPLLMVWSHRPGWLCGKRALDVLLFFGLSFYVGQVLFFNWTPQLLGPVNQAYLIFLLAALAGILFGRHGALLIVLMTLVQVLVGAVSGVGYFADDIQHTQLGNVWTFIFVLSLVSMVQAIAMTERKVQATIDLLTQLPNRLLFQQSLRHELAVAEREQSELALLFIDLDRFKEVNDTLGHHVGDSLLTVAARRIEHCTRKSDIVARLGGDEFTVILPRLQSSHDAERVSSAILQALDSPFYIGDQQIFVTGSIGITVYPEDARSASDLLKNADQAMYSAKARGRNCFNFFTADIQLAAEQRMRLANDLRSALELGQFSVYYQPIADMTLDQVIKAEALLRWNHPALGMISPEIFIPIAEETGQIIEIGDWVMQQAAVKAKEWSGWCGYLFQISVNMSPLQFLNAGTEVDLLEHLRQLDVEGKYLVVEITEGVILDDRPEVAYKLSEYLDAGMEVAIDDFGTGYSSLSYLKKFPIDYLKIDRSFTNDLTTDVTTKELVVAIILMSHSLGLKVIAEGVETPEQRDFLYANGCDYGQGYLYSKPVPAHEFALLLAAQLGVAIDADSSAIDDGELPCPPIHI